MKKIILGILVFLLAAGPLRAGLLISEVACGTGGDDWVEIFFQSDRKEKTDVSRLFVTMYYGANEPLSADPVTLCSWDRPETPWDDRFLVVHLTRPGVPDETDLTGDTDHNGRLDVYCNNYPGSLWNSDGVVAIDSDDDPSNGGIIDFIAYSTRDGEINETIASYVRYARACGQWAAGPEDDPRQGMVLLPPGGLLPSQSVARRNFLDTNTMDDFGVTKYQTPGRENILSEGLAPEKKLFSPLKKKLTFIPTHPVLGKGDIPLQVHEVCSIRLRVFSAAGRMVYESPLYINLYPGPFILPWDLAGRGRAACTGLYLGCIEAVSPSLRRSETEIIYIILSHYR